MTPRPTITDSYRCSCGGLSCLTLGLPVLYNDELMDEQSDQIFQRKKKLETLQTGGVDPYGGRFPGSESILDLLEKNSSTPAEALEQSKREHTLAGRIMGLRRFGKAAFAHLQDRGGRIQVYFKKDVLGDAGFQLFEQLDLGDFVGAAGPLFRTKTHELTLEVKRLTLLAKAVRPLPEKWHGLTDIETRYRQRYLDLAVNPQVREVFVRRGKIIQSIRRFLTERGFLEVETPMMHPIPGGATARPFVTHHNALNQDLFLRIAPELYLKRLIVGGLERVFEINRNFRNEGISTIHNPEFTMLEFYQAYSDYEDLMNLTEELFSAAAQETLGTLIFDYQGNTIDLTPPWRRISYLAAIAKQNNVDEGSLNELQSVRSLAEKKTIAVAGTDSLGKILNQIFEETVEPHLTGPVFVVDYPVEISPLAKRKPAQPGLTERFELYIGARELANAFSELNDPLDQRRRFEAQAALKESGDPEAHGLDEDYLRALEYGMPPTAGEGVGIDRLVMLLTNQPSIRDVILFPQMRPEK